MLQIEAFIKINDLLSLLEHTSKTSSDMLSSFPILSAPSIHLSGSMQFHELLHSSTVVITFVQSGMLMKLVNDHIFVNDFALGHLLILVFQQLSSNIRMRPPYLTFTRLLSSCERLIRIGK